MKQALRDAESAFKDQEDGVSVELIIGIVLVLILADVIKTSIVDNWHSGLNVSAVDSNI